MKIDPYTFDGSVLLQHKAERFYMYNCFHCNYHSSHHQ